MTTIGKGIQVANKIDIVDGTLRDSPTGSTHTIYTVPLGSFVIVNFAANIVTNTATYSIRVDGDILFDFTSGGRTTKYNGTWQQNLVLGPGSVIDVLKTGGGTGGTADMVVKGAEFINS